ncbi:hypothetical protein [Stenotrophomonas sp. ATs4]|uniref:hypothetical protein n=1 Tax=Stenotrophomonas sp. ATs4 TaxID=3402766 RepID=UPI003F71024E
MDKAPPIPGFTTQFTHVVLQSLIENYRKAHGAAPAFVMVTPPQLAMLHASMASRPQGVRKSLQQWRVLASKGRLKVLSLLILVVEPCDGR